ncbi:hypothetical protein Barb6_02932 [Bacteroidales bacterium Barb6]|nr:hypothetical protein Barb6_02932 [Bacteroidales bacterium Barb6]
MTLLFDNTTGCVTLIAKSINTYNRTLNIRFFNQTGKWLLSHCFYPLLSSDLCTVCFLQPEH